MEIKSPILEFRPQGIYCNVGKFYIDPWYPVDKAIITHGHADHARWGMKYYLCHHHTVPILKSRIGPEIVVEGIGYNDPIFINGVKVSLHPAGHIIGSAQVRIEYKGYVVVITGDYKIQNDGLSAPFESVKCNELITESTFGLPIYQWASIEDQNQQLQDWVVYNQSIGKTSVFIGYSLGKAQRIMKALDGMGTIFVHGSIDRLNKAYEEVGIRLPETEYVNFKEDYKKVDKGIVILPPALSDSNIIKKIPNTTEAYCSGWMQVRGARRWRSADAGFAISDHADWNGLISAIQSSEAELVRVTHGQTEAFSKYLNEIGIHSVVLKTEFGDENIEEISKD